MGSSSQDHDLTKQWHPKTYFSALTTPVLSAHAHGRMPRAACELAGAGKSGVGSRSHGDPSHSAQVVLAPARGNLWRLDAELEDVLQQRVGYRGE